ncbi:EamA family transporter [Adhaeribacter radiodurans]|uniref:EamA family transporter n=1 Tax=Adhaeribacter radiodurans TaxID=2745197 RepID=A0A7L7LDN3_9BACT|nr:EamA family transporter [Adhaeribacter radiodurans]QMU30804.1 EamA family transporter [Adhaeribacter radiodurans]
MQIIFTFFVQVPSKTATFALDLHDVVVKPNKYYSAAILAFTIWGFIVFPLRAVANFPSGQILYFRVLFAMLGLATITFLFRRDSLKQTWLAYQSETLRNKRRLILFTVLGGLLLMVNWLVFIYVINHIDIQTGSFSYLLCPILTALLGYLLLKEELRSNQWLAIGISIISCSLIGTGELTNLFYSLLVALSYAFFLITQRVLKQYDKLVLLTLQLIIVFACMGPFYSFFKGTEASPELNLSFYGAIFVLSFLFTILPLFLNMYALKELKSGTIGILMYINPIINFLIAFLYFQEKTSSEKAIAYGLIFLSIIIYNLPVRKKIPTTKLATHAGK